MTLVSNAARAALLTRLPPSEFILRWCDGVAVLESLLCFLLIETREIAVLFIGKGKYKCKRTHERQVVWCVMTRKEVGCVQTSARALESSKNSKIRFRRIPFLWMLHVKVKVSVFDILFVHLHPLVSKPEHLGSRCRNVLVQIRAWSEEAKKHPRPFLGEIYFQVLYSYSGTMFWSIEYWPDNHEISILNLTSEYHLRGRMNEAVQKLGEISLKKQLKSIDHSHFIK